MWANGWLFTPPPMCPLSASLLGIRLPNWALQRLNTKLFWPDLVLDISWHCLPVWVYRSLPAGWGHRRTLNRCKKIQVIFKKYFKLNNTKNRTVSHKHGGGSHTVLTYNRVQSSVWHLPNPHPPLHPASVSSPRIKGGGHTRGGEGVGGNILEDAKHWIGLLQYNPST